MKYQIYNKKNQFLSKNIIIVIIVIIAININKLNMKSILLFIITNLKCNTRRYNSIINQTL